MKTYVKKIVTVLFAILFCLALFALAACGESSESGNGGEDESEAKEVSLRAINATDIGVIDCDYYVAAEPAATTRVNAMAASGLQFVGDLQELYGGEDGYPQAVVVAKADLTEYSILSDFCDELALSAAWLLSEDTTADEIVAPIDEILENNNVNPTFTADNLTKEVIENCAISFERVTESNKGGITEYMDKVNGVADTPFGEAAGDFFFTGEFGTEKYEGTLKVVAPDGAPAVGLSYLMNEADLGLSFDVVDSSTIQTYVTGNNPEADICVLPVNTAVNILGSGDTYKMLGTLTHGNLYLLSSKYTEPVTRDNLSSLQGKTVGVVNLAAVPGLTFKLILKDNDISYVTVQ